jgi:hypothetical protein
MRTPVCELLGIDQPVVIGVGERFDDGKLQAYPPGAVIALPGGTPHFHWARSGEYVTQVTAFGPISLEYLNPEDDPRNK